MVSFTDYAARTGLISSADDAETTTPPRKRRFRLFSTLAAPFRDIDERALHAKRGRTQPGPTRNNSKGNLFAHSAAAPAKVPVRRFRRGDD